MYNNRCIIKGNFVLRLHLSSNHIGIPYLYIVSCKMNMLHIFVLFVTKNEQYNINKNL